MKALTLTCLLLGSFLFAQQFQLKNTQLKEYFTHIRKAENLLVNQHFDASLKSYKTSFSLFDKPFGKDIYNSMHLAMQLKDYKYAYKAYSQLECMDYPFAEKFLAEKFPKSYLNKKSKCVKTIDYAYKKELDSLFEMDQHYRRLANGDLNNKKEEITLSDSIASHRLLNLIKEKGFPNEHNIGLGSANGYFLQNFYLIIWHQLKNNSISKQHINFSIILEEALNQGKIIPEHAADLIDLNNGTSKYTIPHFFVISIWTDNGRGESIRDQVINKTYIEDCCYVHPYYYETNRPAVFQKSVDKVNADRKLLGLHPLDFATRRTHFSLKNKQYYLPQMSESSFIIGEEQLKKKKATLIKFK